MFWIIVFIIVVGLIIEGGKPKARNRGTSEGASSKPSQNQRFEDIVNKSFDNKIKAQEKKVRRQAREETAKTDRLLAELGVEPWEPENGTKADEKSEAATKRISTVASTRSSENANYRPELSSSLARDFQRWGVSSLWHMTHIQNVQNIVKHGLFSHQSPQLLALNAIDISDHDVQRWRTKADPHYGLSLHDYVPLYINPRNPMLYRRKEMQRDICLIEVSLDALEKGCFLISDGNAASGNTKFFKSTADLRFLPWDVLRSSFWTDFDDGKRKACSEVLVPNSIEPRFIRAVYCFSKAEAAVLGQKGIKSVISVDKYFR